MEDLAERGYDIFLLKAWRLHALKKKTKPKLFRLFGSLGTCGSCILSWAFLLKEL